MAFNRVFFQRNLSETFPCVRDPFPKLLLSNCRHPFVDSSRWLCHRLWNSIRLLCRLRNRTKLWLFSWRNWNCSDSFVAPNFSPCHPSCWNNCGFSRGDFDLSSRATRNSARVFSNCSNLPTNLPNTLSDSNPTCCSKSFPLSDTSMSNLYSMTCSRIKGNSSILACRSPTSECWADSMTAPAVTDN